MDDKNKKYVDRFRNRIIFPVRNLNNFILALGARSVSKTTYAKYINSPETKKVCEEVIKSLGASSVKDMGKIMGFIKKKYSDSIDFSKVNLIVKGLLN